MDTELVTYGVYKILSAKQGEEVEEIGNRFDKDGLIQSGIFKGEKIIKEVKVEDSELGSGFLMAGIGLLSNQNIKIYRYESKRTR